ncbi:MAG: arginyl-tRNA synthetase [Bacillota bacterium]|nr:MAG: arginyl-tRNA synthetase [Bacillota bacterium]
MEKFKLQVAERLAPLMQKTPQEVRALMEAPPNPAWGDIAIPCFFLAKVLRKAPPAIADELAAKAELPGLASKVEAMGGYLNVTLDSILVAKDILSGILETGASYAYTNAGADKGIVIDFSSPNIAKPFGIGHLRTTVIGNSLSRIFKELGYNVVRVNHLGDWGTQFGKLIVAYQLFANGDPLIYDPIGTLYRIYVEYHKEAEARPELEDEARAWFKRLEDGDAEAKRYWNLFVEVSLKDYKRVYDLLDIEFDAYMGESFYEPLLNPTVQEIEDKGLTQVSDGAVIVDLEPYGMPPCLLRKTDGSTLYATRDLAAALYRERTYRPEQMLYVVGQEQTLHFKQVKQVLELMQEPAGEKLVHVSFGLFRFPEGRMSTRRGKTIFLEDVLNKSIEMAAEIINQKNPELDDREQVARQVGVGAIVFGDLKNGRIKDVAFDWEEILNFDGETGPYVQYTHARACSVLRKAGGSVANLSNESVLTDEFALPLIKLLGEFPQVIERAALQYEPSVLSRYVLDVAQGFNRFYHNCRIIGQEVSVMQARLALVKGTQQILERSMYLLGIAAPEKM